VFGLSKALLDLGNLLDPDGSVPRGRFLFLLLAGVNICSGLFYGPPFTISSESSAGIKSGAKTGLSSVVTGIIFLFSVFFGPFFLAIPLAG
jgi:adenine/guanine/hypoxanthine permease